MRTTLLPLITLLVPLLIIGTGCRDKKLKVVEASGSTMGTTYQITVVEPPENINKTQLAKQATVLLDNLNGLISTYDPESELSRFNAQQTTDWFPIASETIELIEHARRVSKDTLGAYDITLGSISAVWGFGSKDGETEENQEKGDTPDMDKILLLLNDVGYQLLQISSREQQVRKLAAGLTVDLSSIGKGYAVDQLGELLESLGATRYLVEIGGEIRTRGLASDNETWKIGIEWPESGQSEAPQGVAVENAHIATSGDYRNYREIDGQRYSHLLDGRTGFPITHNLVSVTVLHGSTTFADAWATAFMALGFEESMVIAKDKGLAASFTLREGDGFVVRNTRAFDAYSYTAK